MAIDDSKTYLTSNEQLNQLSTQNNLPDMSNNLNIISSLETYKCKQTEKYLSIPFELNITRHRRRLTGDDNNEKKSNIKVPPSAVTKTKHDDRKKVKGGLSAKKKKLTKGICFLGWIVFLPCCFLGFLLREPPENADDLNEDPCWPGALLRSHDDE